MAKSNFLKNKKAIIFDFDGTLADTIGIWNYVDKKAIKELAGIDVDLDTIQKERDLIVTKNNDKPVYEFYVGYLVEKYKMKCSVEDAINTRRKISYEYITQKIDYKENADKVLVKLKQAGYILALATTTAKRTIDKYNSENMNLVSKAKFDKIFDLILSNDEVKEKKPSPEIYLKAVEILKVNKEQCLVVEDSLEGVTSAKRAGIDVLNIPDSYSAINQSKIDELADYKLKDFKEFLEIIS